MTRWELMKAAWKGREPVSTSEIVSGIRAGTIKALQPAVRAGEQFRVARPEIAERISRTPAASQIRASVQLRRDIDTAKRQVISSEKSIVLLKTKIDKAPVQNGVFTGTDKQFLQHEKDVKAYNTNIGRINASNERIAALEGEKFIPKIERAVSSHIPTLADISRKGAQFRVKYPEASAKIYSTFQAAHVKTERVGTQSQREALAGYTYGSYSSLQKQPVKTAASFAIGGASVKAMRMVGLVGKAYGAGKWSKRMGKAAQYGIILYYGKKSAEYIMSAPNARVAGERAAEIMYTELLPMAAGIKVAQITPRLVSAGKVRAKTIKTKAQKTVQNTIKTLEKKRTTTIDKLNAGKRKGNLSKKELTRLNDQIRTYNARIKTKRKELLNIRRGIRAKLTEFELKQRALEGKTTLTDTEMDKLISSFKPREFGIKKMPVKTVSKFNKLKHDIKYLVPRIKTLKLKIKRGKGLSKKQLTNLQSDLKLSDAKLVNKRKELLNIRKQIRSKLTDIELKQKALEAEEFKPLTDANMKSMLDLFKEPKKPKIKDIGKEFRVETAKKEAAVKRGELLEIQQKDGTIALQKVVQKQKQVAKTVVKVKTEVKTATKTSAKVKTEVQTATKVKIKTKTQQKSKVKSLIALRTSTQQNVQSLTGSLTQLKKAAKEMQKIRTTPKTKKKVAASMAAAIKTKTQTLVELDSQQRVASKAIAEQKAAAKKLTDAIRRVQNIKLVIPPAVMKPRLPTKKKITKKRTKIMTLEQKNLNAVVTFRDLLGGL